MENKSLLSERLNGEFATKCERHKMELLRGGCRRGWAPLADGAGVLSCHPQLTLPCCCSVNADPKVSIKGAVGRVVTATPMQALASPVTFSSGPCCG